MSFDEKYEDEYFDFDIPELKYPNIRLETDDIIMTLVLKKDYSMVKNKQKRKIEFLNDLKDFIDEFATNPEFEEIINHY